MSAQFASIIVAALFLISATVAISNYHIDPSLTTDFSHYWKRSFGSCHAATGLRRDWQEQLRQTRDEIGVERIRLHGIFDDDMSVVLGPKQYSFFNIDQLHDALLELNIRPIVELSFMPGLLANCSPWAPAPAPACQTVMHYQGVVQPPTNYSLWEDLCYEFAKHLVERYGAAEVREWHFEVWNELWGMPYPTEYLQLYFASYRGIKRADPALKVGGPSTMQCQWVDEFVRDTKGQFDFVSTHLYPTDPNCTEPHISPDADCFAHTIQKAKAAVPANKPYFITEYNAGLFDPWMLYSSYAAAFLYHNLPLLYGVADVFSYWAFTDIFEEDGMHSAPFDGFNYGIQTQHGIKKPIYRAFQMLKDCGSRRVTVSSNASKESFVTVFSTLNTTSSYPNAKRTVSVFLANFAPKWWNVAPEEVQIILDVPTITCSGSLLAARLRSLDESWPNPHAAWESMGSPSYPTKEQMARLQAASEVRVMNVNVTAGLRSCTAILRLMPFSAHRLDFHMLV